MKNNKINLYLKLKSCLKFYVKNFSDNYKIKNLIINLNKILSEKLKGIRISQKMSYVTLNLIIEIVNCEYIYTINLIENELDMTLLNNYLPKKNKLLKNILKIR